MGKGESYMNLTPTCSFWDKKKTLSPLRASPLGTENICIPYATSTATHRQIRHFPAGAFSWVLFISSTISFLLNPFETIKKICSMERLSDVGINRCVLTCSSTHRPHHRDKPLDPQSPGGPDSGPCRDFGDHRGWGRERVPL